MIKKTLIILSILFFSCITVYGKEYGNIEIFDINKTSIIKTSVSSDKIEKEVKIYLKNITGVYGKFNPIPNKGYMIKIPLNAPISIETTWINSFVDEVILIFPENESPYLMVIDNKERAIFLTFNSDTSTLLRYLKFNPESSINLFHWNLKST